MRYTTRIEISVWGEAADIDMIRGCPWRSFFGQLGDVPVELVLAEPNNLKIVEDLRCSPAMTGNVMLYFTENQAFSGVVGANKDRDPLGWYDKRLRKL